MLDDEKDLNDYAKFFLAFYVLLCILVAAYWYGRWYNEDSFKEPLQPMVADCVHIPRDKPEVSGYVPGTYINCHFGPTVPDKGPTPIGEGPGQIAVLRDPPPLIREFKAL